MLIIVSISQAFSIFFSGWTLSNVVTGALVAYGMRARRLVVVNASLPASFFLTLLGVSYLPIVCPRALTYNCNAVASCCL